jgi:regulator of replication initiation timing
MGEAKGFGNSIQLKQQVMKKNFTSPPQRSFSVDSLNARYAMLEVTEVLEQLVAQIAALKDQVGQLRKEQQELQLQQIEKTKEFLTIEDVEKLYDISRRTQQDERAAEKLGHRKKENGNKILYEPKHIRDYVKDHYAEYPAKTKKL